jgi:uncharacterized protein YbjT (DUF2867 family)
MASKKLLVVFGATGVQGGSVVKAILGDHKLRESWAVRGITRDTSKPSAKALQSLGAETVSVSLCALLDSRSGLNAPLRPIWMMPPP